MALVPLLLNIATSHLLAQSVDARWMERETPHFRFVFNEADRDAAVALIADAETAYEKVTRFYGVYPEKILCILRSDTPFANGAFSPISPHIEIVTSAPSTPWLGAFTESWLRSVFLHELAHFVQLSAEYGLFGSIAKLLGPSIATLPGAFLPGWMIEGPAVFAETRFSEGGRGRNAFFEIQARALILEDELFTLRQAAHLSDFPPPGRIYLAGYLMVDHLIREYGEEVFRSILRRFARFPIFGPWRAIEVETGVSASALYDKLVMGLRERYEELAPSGNSMRISPEGLGDYHVPIQTKSGWILYRTRPDMPAAIVEFDPETGAEEVILEASLSDPYSLSASADGSVIAFATPVSVVNPFGNVLRSDLYLYSRDQAILTHVASGALRHPALSPDGKQLLAIRQEDSFASLVEVDVATRGVSTLLRIPETDLFTPVVDGDSASIYLTANTAGVQDIVSIPLAAPKHQGSADDGDEWNTRLVERITDTPRVAEFYPRISGGSLIFGAEERGLLELYRLRADSDLPELLVRDRVGAFAGFMEGDRVVYGSYGSSGWILKRGPAAVLRQDSPWAESEDSAIVNTSARLGQEINLPAWPGPKDGSAEETETRYFDTPRLAYWFPVPLVFDPMDRSQIALGPGFSLLAVSPVRGHTVAIDVGVRPGVWQPGIRARTRMAIGEQSLEFEIRHGYREAVSGISSETLDLSAFHFIPVVGFARYPVSRSLALGWMARYQIHLADDQPFPPFGAESFTETLLMSIFVSTRFVRRGARLAARSPLSLSASTQSDVATLRPYAEYPVLTQRYSLEGTMPIGNIHVVGLQIRGAAKSTPDRIPSVRPGTTFSPDPEYRSVDGLVELRYYTPRLPLDVPIPGDFHLSGVRAELFSQVYGSALPGFSFDPSLYLGAEIEISIGRTIHAPFSVGFALRIPFSRSITLPDDIGFYWSGGSLLGEITDQ